MNPQKKKRVFVSFELTLLLLSLFSFAHMLSLAHPVYAQSTVSEPSVCCERTKEGALCVNTDQANCAEGARSTPTSCETTSYCKLGTCFDSDEGICMENTPQSVCNQNGGTWDAREVDQIPQCQLGCCIIGDQAAFVPPVRCKKLSNYYGVENNFRTDITSEAACIAVAQAQDKGACIYEKDFERICEFTTREDCGADEVVEVNGTEVDLSSGRKFYKDMLCSAEELNTACAKQTGTTCSDGKVYWTDSCGNLENVYSANKDASWNKGRVAEPDEVCTASDGSDTSCGNCDYLLGTRCSEYDSLIGRPADSDYYCKRTECVDRAGNKRINGESWCVYDGAAGNGRDAAGSRHFREICVDGEVEVEACADFRNEICLQGSIETDKGDFATSACRVNRWQECTRHDEVDDCTDENDRDCIWLPKVTGLGEFTDEDSTSNGGFSNPTGGRSFSNPTANVIAPITGQATLERDEKDTGYTGDEGVCVPNVPPGLKFWEDSSAASICAQASAKCTVVYEKGLLSGRSVKSGEECLGDEWAMKANQICASLGDCGGYVNFQGDFTDDGYEWKVDGEKEEFSPNTKNKIGRGFVGLVLAAILGERAFPLVSAQEVVPGDPGFIGPLTQKQQSALAAKKTATLVPETTTLKAAFPNQFVTTQATTLQGVSIPKGATLAINDGGAYVIKDAAGKSIGTLSKTGAEQAFKNGLIQTPAEPAKSYLAQGYEKLTGQTIEAAGFGNALLSGIQWAAIGYLAGQLLGGVIGLDQEQTQALSTAIASGAFSYSFFSTYSKTSELFLASPWTAVAVGVVVFVVMYKDVDEEVITFECKPWQPPKGGDSCEACNDDDLPCSEYRCRSLGQTCELVNKGTDQEKCVNVHPNDVTPPTITPDQEVLTKGHTYTDVKNSPPGPGFRITNPASSDGCLKAYTPLTFGIKTNEQAQCRIDFTSTGAFEDMRNFMGGSNLFSTEHEERFSLPGAKVLQNSSLTLENGKDLTFFIRCADKNGNENEAEYAVSFCMDDAPDTTPPQIEATSIQNNGCVAESKTSANVEFYTNEPAQCRWSTRDQSYENMKNDMSCSNAFHQVNSLQLFTCKANLTGIARDNSDYFVRCEDQPDAAVNDRNRMAESFKFSLHSSSALKMKELQPNETIFGGTSPAPVTLHAETLFGCNNGQAMCFYSTTDDERDFIQFADTNTEDGHHNQRQDLVAGNYNYRVKCVDGGGNVARGNIKFKLEIDENAPVVARAYQEDNQLKIVTVRNSECSYSFDDCDFSFSEGTQMPIANTTVHVADWKDDKTYHIKCRDEFRNEEAKCSIIVRPSDIEF